MSRRNVISPGPGSSTAGRAVTSRSLSPPRSMPISSVLNTGAGPSTSGRSRTDVHGKIVKPGASVAAVHRMVQADGSLAHAVWTVPVLRPPAQAGIATRSGDQHSVSSTTREMRASLQLCDVQQAYRTICYRSSPTSSLIHQVLDSAKTGLGGGDLWAISTNACT